ncbi:hypothetical protein TIFTF001_053746 [Ficus carica]|uniref:Uncharacterized protein n=1 Tax=Ficus carica TaxID=3494 RepID=A0AA88JGX3_FICCA|nr:hypothetical protein TIFTF001_053746 [Ficus carica]
MRQLLRARFWYAQATFCNARVRREFLNAWRHSADEEASSRALDCLRSSGPGTLYWFDVVSWRLATGYACAALAHLRDLSADPTV